MATKIKKSSFQEISGIFPDLLTLKVNINNSLVEGNLCEHSSLHVYLITISCK